MFCQFLSYFTIDSTLVQKIFFLYKTVSLDLLGQRRKVVVNNILDNLIKEGEYSMSAIFLFII